MPCVKARYRLQALAQKTLRSDPGHPAPGEVNQGIWIPRIFPLPTRLAGKMRPRGCTPDTVGSLLCGARTRDARNSEKWSFDQADEPYSVCDVTPTEYERVCNCLHQDFSPWTKCKVIGRAIYNKAPGERRSHGSLAGVPWPGPVSVLLPPGRDPHTCLVIAPKNFLPFEMSRERPAYRP